eukprot:1152374-Pelagomonas_calceolata.AAC.1
MPPCVCDTWLGFGDGCDTWLGFGSSLSGTPSARPPTCMPPCMASLPREPTVPQRSCTKLVLDYSLSCHVLGPTCCACCLIAPLRGHVVEGQGCISLCSMLCPFARADGA